MISLINGPVPQQTSDIYILCAEALNKFLHAHKVAKGSVFSHTSLGNYVHDEDGNAVLDDNDNHVIVGRGSYYIPPRDMSEFMKLYIAAYQANVPLSMTEARKPISPLTIDLDFRQDKPERIYTLADITKIVKHLGLIIRDYIAEADEAAYDCHILEKPAPRPNKSGGYKDGVHLHFPNIVSVPALQYSIRSRFLEEHSKLPELRGFTNTAVNIYDEAVIEKNNWMMYGSKKPDELHPWTVGDIQVLYDPTGVSEFRDCESDIELITKLSIRSAMLEESRYSPNGLVAIKAYNKQISKRHAISSSSISSTSSETVSVVTRHPDTSHPDSIDIEFITKLVCLLSNERADNYDDWLHVGWCLHNIQHDNPELDLLPVWINFSSLSFKFEEGECERRWSEMYYKDDGYKMGSLCKWAQADDKDGYKTLNKSRRANNAKKHNTSSGTGEEKDIPLNWAYFDKLPSVDDNFLLKCLEQGDYGLSLLAAHLFKEIIKYDNDYYFFYCSNTLC